MSSYNGRRPVNVTQYLNTLGAIPSSEELLEAYNPADDLALWTDSTFFDFDIGEHIARPSSAGVSAEEKPAAIDPTLKDHSNFDGFLDGTDLQVQPFDQPFDYSPEFTSFAEPPPPPQAAVAAPSPAAPTTAASSPAPIAAPRSTKRKATSSPDAASPDNLEEGSRLAAEEDKRRRNTAASARFRIKKKQKEQQLEKTAREMTDRVATLEQRIQTLEMENKWLKNLIVEKNGGKSGEELMIPPTHRNSTGTAPAIAAARVESTGFRK